MAKKNGGDSIEMAVKEKKTWKNMKKTPGWLYVLNDLNGSMIGASNFEP